MMKQQISISCLFSLLMSAFLLQGCLQDKCEATQTFIRYTPIYKQVDEIRLNVKAEAAQPLKNPGKIYAYKQYFFINEIRNGIHIIDNSNPKAPQKKAFIKIPGNVDIAIKGDILYADNYIDLIAIDISQPEQPKLVHREQDIFNSFTQDRDLGYLVHFEESLETTEIACDDPRFRDGFFWRGRDLFARNDFLASAEFGGASKTGSNSSNTGVAGSMARFGIYQDFLYTIDQVQLKVFNIEKLSSPRFINDVNVGWGIETIFPYKDKLFIGAVDGLYIFENSSPTQPRQLSKFTHARACDPVVVDDNTAYVTLRSGNQCDGFNNQLDIVDITDLLRPSLIKTHAMQNPHGLALKEKVVFICDGEHGLKSYNVEDPLNIKLLDHKKIATYDAILLPQNNLLMVIGKDGFYQYDVENPKDMKQLSFMPVEK